MELAAAAGLKQTISEIQKGKILPVYVVLGDENYVMKEAAQGMIAALLPGKEKDLNLEVVEGAEEDWDRIIPALQTYPWFGQRRVIVVKDTKVFFSKFLLEDVIAKSRIKYETGNLAEAVKLYRFVLGHQGYKKILDIADEAFPQLPGYQPHSKTEVWLKAVIEECRRKGLDPIPYEDNSEKLLKALGRDGKGIPEKNTLILVTDHVDRRKSLYKVINEIGAVIDFSVSRTKRDAAEVESDEKRILFEQAEGLLKSARKTISKEAFELLVNKTGFHVGVFRSELEKIVVFLKDNPRIEPADVDAMVGRTKEDSIFDLQRAVGRRDLKKALFYLRELLAQKEIPLVLLQGVATEIRYLAVAKEYLAAELKTKWNPRMSAEAFKKTVYFPIILKKKKEMPDKSRTNIFRLPLNVLFELFRNSGKYAPEELQEALKLLAEADLKMKSLRTPPETILEETLFTLLLPPFDKVGDVDEKDNFSKP
jgi:DNA polymerase-3 subunit delta